jgi:hypothetical protein
MDACLLAGLAGSHLEVVVAVVDSDGGASEEEA